MKTLINVIYYEILNKLIFYNIYFPNLEIRVTIQKIYNYAHNIELRTLLSFFIS